MHESEKWKWSRSVVSDSLRPHELQPTRLLCPWDFPGKSTGLGCHRLLHWVWGARYHQKGMPCLLGPVDHLAHLPKRPLALKGTWIWGLGAWVGVIPQVLNSGCGVQENGADILSPSLLVLEPTENPESLFLYLHKGKGDKVESKYLTNLHIASHILNHTILKQPYDVLSLFLFYRWGNWSTDWLNNLQSEREGPGLNPGPRAPELQTSTSRSLVNNVER